MIERTAAFKMEGRILTLVLLIWLNHGCIASSETRVEVTSPVNSVAVGGILAVQCQIWNMEKRYTVTIVHTSDGQSEVISTDEDIRSSSPQASRAFLAVRTFPDGSVVYFLTLINGVPSDHGEYSCIISSWVGASFTEISKHAIRMDVVSFPDNTQPICSSNPSKLIFQEEVALELICASYKTYPKVDLKWRSLVSYEIIPSINTSRFETVSSTLRLRTELNYNGAIFECEMTSSAFSDHIRTCQVGPITVISSEEAIRSGSNTSPKDPNVPDTVLSLQTKAPLLTSNCKNKCTGESQTVFYLTITTAVTCLLLVVFFITTMVMCCKYHSISSLASRRQSCTSPVPIADPVYVSLQRRRENERVYMTLEDPNNPEGKVLLPKEVFDEFYNRTLSLRKT